MTAPAGARRWDAHPEPHPRDWALRRRQSLSAVSRHAAVAGTLPTCPWYEKADRSGRLRRCDLEARYGIEILEGMMAPPAHDQQLVTINPRFPSRLTLRCCSICWSPAHLIRRRISLVCRSRAAKGMSLSCQPSRPPISMLLADLRPCFVHLRRFFFLLRPVPSFF